MTFVVEMEILSVTFVKTKSKGDIRQIVDPLHIQQIITSDSKIKESIGKDMSKLTRQKSSSKSKHTDTDRGEGRDEDTNGNGKGNGKVAALAAEMKEMKRQMEYQDKLRNISMKAMSVRVEEQKKEIQRLQVQIQEMSMEMSSLKAQFGHHDANDIDDVDVDRDSPHEHSQLTQHSHIESAFNANEMH